MEKQRVMQAFKLACLNYNPSKVIVDRVEMERGAAIGAAIQALQESQNIGKRVGKIEEEYLEEVKPEFMKLEGT